MPNNNFSPASQRFQEAILRFPALWLLLICLVVYGRGLGGDFVLDDWPVVKENSHITDFGYLADYFTGDVWGNTELNPLEDSESYPLYRPLFLVALNAGHHLWLDYPFSLPCFYRRTEREHRLFLVQHRYCSSFR